MNGASDERAVENAYRDIDRYVAEISAPPEHIAQASQPREHNAEAPRPAEASQPREHSAEALQPSEHIAAASQPSEAPPLSLSQRLQVLGERHVGTLVAPQDVAAPSRKMTTPLPPNEF